MKKSTCKSIFLIINIILITLLQGCATALLSQAPVTSKKVQYSTFSHDLIRAVGYPLENGQRVSGILLIGDKFSYLVSRGQDRVEIMMSNLNHDHVILEDQISLIKNIDKFHGHVRFNYNVNLDYSSDEISALSRLCKTQKLQGRWFGLGDPQISYYDCEVFIAGTIFSNHENNPGDGIEFQNGRRVILLVNDGTIESIDTAKVSDKLFALPFAVGFDIVTAPLQIFLLSNINK